MVCWSCSSSFSSLSPLSFISPSFSLHPPSLFSTILYQSTLQTVSTWTPLTTPPPVPSLSAGTVCSQGFVREHFSSTNPSPSASSSPDWRWAYSSSSSLSPSSHFQPITCLFLPSLPLSLSSIFLPPHSLTLTPTLTPTWPSFFFLLLLPLSSLSSLSTPLSK